MSAAKGQPAQGEGNPQQGRGRRVRPEPPQPGAPAATLPNLDDVRRRPPPALHAPPPVPSTMRSQRKPLEPRRGRRAGEPSPSALGGGLYGRGGGGNGSNTTAFRPPNARAETAALRPGAWKGLALPRWVNDKKGSGFDLARFLIFPSHGQIQSTPFSVSLLNPSTHFFAPPVPQAGGAKIAFASNRDGHAQIYLMNADGSGQVRLTYNGGNDDHPRWSPDGSKILFQSDRDNTATGHNDIYVMNPDGSAQTRLTTDASDDSAPSWSPDGSKIVFQSLRNGQYYQVYSMNADGTNQVNLGNSGGSDRQPSWSPNGAKIAFASERDHAGYASIYVMNANGTGQQRLTFSADMVSDEQPVWSRDGSKIAFVSTRDSVVESWQETDDAGGVLYRTAVRTNKEVYVMNTDGTGQTRLTNALGNDDAPYWSPDGSKIVFRSDHDRDCCDPTSQVWVMNADGTGAINLSGNGFGDYGSSWTSGGGNQPPVANAGDSYSGITGQNTVFSGSGSFDPDGSVASYSWSFGDGTTGTGVSPTHSYASAGSYTVTLTVTDNLGAQASATAAVSISSSSSDQFVASFLQWGLSRQPGGDEGSYWTDILRAAYPRGQTSMVLAVRELGMTVFESAEYAARNRSDHWYVYDLYKTYLMRDPDPGGWAFWESNLPSMGREQLRHAFHESIEFNNIVATLTASGAPSSAVSSLAAARVDPFNQTGDQLRARDCEWGVTLLSLPGRAGLDLGLGLSYSSLVWTRSGPYAYFDEDRGSPSPGFRLGFATIQGPYFDAQASRNVYVLITSSGRRTGLRQVGTSNVYEAADSSYLQLIAGGGSLLLRSTDGTQMSYSSSANGWRATAIEDRNGNFISVSYDWRGDITDITDTLGRTVTFNYDANANLSTITQSWQVNGVPQTHTWASFGWGTRALQPGFSSVAAVGTYGGEVIPVLTQVGLHDGSRYNFEYTGAGQVNVIRRSTSDNVERSRMTYDYATLADDCPRVIGARVWAENWTGTGGVPAEVVTQLSDPGDGSHVMTAPDGTVYKESYGTGWQKGLVTQSEVRSGGVVQKLTTTQWTQDDTSVGYQTNPRVTETNVYDFPVDAPSNRLRTTVDYGQYAQYGLPHLVTEYGSGGVTPVRQSYTDYNVSQPYLDRRIIGLVSSSRVYDPVAAQWQAKTTYAYDEAGSVQPQATTATGHDQSFGASFLTRGNVTSVSRWDVTDIDNAAKALTTRMSYDAAGSVLSGTDPLGHQNSIGYADSFSDGDNSRNTFAYPTTLTDADGFSSSIQYSFDFGAQTRVEGPPPAGQPNGVIRTFAHDGAARVERVTIQNSGAYVRYLYGPNHVVTLSSVNTVADEAYTNTVFDGLGRVVGVAGNNPGSDGGYKAQVTQYDLMGRGVKRSNPAEIDGSWNPAGDDSAGWLYTHQSYDWKGRPRIKTSTDGTQKSATYDGCGCAGGEVVTLTDEAGRRRKVYSDALGRQRKTEVLNWDGSVYSAMTNTYNALDQITEVKEQAGVSGTAQFTTMTYDGHGRLETRHVPGQDAGRATSYTYDADDAVQSITDARGAKATYGYNGRHLLTGVSYDMTGVLAGQTVAATPNVTYEYDSVGNRVAMDDGPGRVDYTYDALSRLTAETRQFDGLGSFTVNSDYTLTGALKWVSDPTGARVDYAYDAAGRMTGVTGTPFANVSTYASNLQYRAWGDLKHVEYGNTRSADITYNERLQPETYVVPGLMSKRYEYHADGLLRYTQDLLNPKFDRSYSYDFAGRLGEAFSGPAARGEADSDSRPYKQTYQYDAFGHMTSRTVRHWSEAGGIEYPSPQTYVNERGTATHPDGTPVWHYDAAGHLTDSFYVTYAYDAAGRTARSISSESDITPVYDGDGRRVKAVEVIFYADQNGATQSQTTTTFYVTSSVLGGRVLTELSATGQKQRTFVYAGAAVVAWQVRPEQGADYVRWEHRDTSNASYRLAGPTGLVVSADRAELDPAGSDAGLSDPYPLTETGIVMPPKYPGFGDLGSNSQTCVVDFLPTSCTLAMGMIERGTAEFCPNNYCGPRVMTNGVEERLVPMTRDPDTGQLGYFPDLWNGQRRRARQQRKENPLDKLISKTKLSQEDCDKHLASIFGGEGALVTTAVEPRYVRGWQNGDYLGREGHSIGTAHIYADKYALSRVDRLYAPAGGKLDRNLRGEYAETDTDGSIRGWSNRFQFNYAGGLSIRFFHVGGTVGGNEGGQTLQPKPSVKNAVGSEMIGYIGGIGGEGDPKPGGFGAYNHTHMQFYRNGKLTDPRKIFCGW